MALDKASPRWHVFLGPLAAIPLIESRALAERFGLKSVQMPLLLAACLMGFGLLLIVAATQRGRDYRQPSK